ncbi:hypothetical protein [Pseudomonas viridiflava]|uniref:hypothetical protein n=1 Tax=Pseudomonas viridiflava TaxID=33069 RepID=UPI000F02B096|nr:hypothetical protein [Pseudomonas viridiflava]
MKHATFSFRLSVFRHFQLPAIFSPVSADTLRHRFEELMMSIEDNGPENAYPGPAEPGSEDEVYPDKESEQADDEDTSRNDMSDDPDMPVNPPVDETEVPSLGSGA